MFGSGVSPGFVEVLAIVAANVCDRIDKVTVVEEADTTLYDSPATELPAGFARPIDDPELPAMAARGTAVFGEAVALVADALGVELDEIVCEAEFAQTTEDLDLGSWQIPAGHVAGLFASWRGRIGGRTIVELSVRWKKGTTLEPDWQINEGHVIEIAGRPTIRTSVQFLPPPDFEATTFEDFMVLGMIMTAMPAVNAIPGCRRRGSRHRHVHRSPVDPAARVGARRSPSECSDATSRGTPRRRGVGSRRSAPSALLVLARRRLASARVLRRGERTCARSDRSARQRAGAVAGRAAHESPARRMAGEGLDRPRRERVVRTGVVRDRSPRCRGLGRRVDRTARAGARRRGRASGVRAAPAVRARLRCAGRAPLRDGPRRVRDLPERAASR